MAAKKKSNPVNEAEEQIAIPVDPDLDMDDDEDEDEVNGRLNLEENLTTAVPIKDNSYKGPTVRVFIQPPPEAEEGSGMKVDMYEHVTIANEKGEEHTRILRGEWVDIPVPVYMQLKAKYPKL